MIIRSQSGFYTVETQAGLVTCRLRGRLKRGPRLGDILAVGDRVKISMQLDGSGMIEEIEERERMFSRMAPTPRGEYQQILIANPDQVVFVFACADPEPRLRMLDRFLVVAEKAETPVLIVFNKVDLIGMKQARTDFGHYDALGYPVIYTSVESGVGISELENKLVGKVSILAGPSGVGKSSLLNRLARRRVSIVDPTPGVTRDENRAELDPEQANRVAEALHRFRITHHLAEIHHVVVPPRERGRHHHVSPRQDPHIVTVAVGEVPALHCSLEIVVCRHPMGRDIVACAAE